MQIRVRSARKPARARKRNLPPPAGGLAGFSLGEVLVALAIAAVLTAVLVRYVGSTRMNAARVGEAVEMASLAETLMARIAPGAHLAPGRTDGRSGALAWRVEITPAPFNATARRVREKKKAMAEKQPGAPKRMMEPFSLGIRNAPGAATAAATEPAEPVTEWIPYRIAVVIQAPSGRTHATDTIRIAPPASEER